LIVAETDPRFTPITKFRIFHTPVPRFQKKGTSCSGSICIRTAPKIIVSKLFGIIRRESCYKAQLANSWWQDSMVHNRRTNNVSRSRLEKEDMLIDVFKTRPLYPHPRRCYLSARRITSFIRSPRRGATYGRPETGASRDSVKFPFRFAACTERMYAHRNRRSVFIRPDEDKMRRTALVN
jgi:hypothetical protein